MDRCLQFCALLVVFVAWAYFQQFSVDSAIRSSLPLRWNGLDSSRAWDVLYHVGGNGPWIEKIDGVVEGGIEPPEGCSVEQIHMLSRHAERYPTVGAGDRMLALLDRIQDWNGTLTGDLAFVNNWTYFTNDPSAHHGQLTTTGPYAGNLTAVKTGNKLRARYSHLLPVQGSPPVNLWASDCNRVIETARHFSTGFFGLDSSSSAKLHVIPETSDLGADTLTPGDTCLNYRLDFHRGHDNGARQLVNFRSTYLPSVSSRLHKQNPGITFSDAEIYSMQELCGFETLVRGKSQWCEAFSHEEWLNFEYARDVIHYYRSGPGNPFGPVMGWLWLNATAELLETGPNAGKLFFSFVHDGDVIPMLAALDIFYSPEQLPTTHRPRSRTWRTSQVVPMGGRVIFERLSCQTRTPPSVDKDGQAQNLFKIGEESIQPTSEFVRININDGIVALPTCSSGPGSSCPLDQFLGLVRARGTHIGDFREICGLGPDAAARITFLHQ